jgi:ribose transport system ATP-binding protein
MNRTESLLKLSGITKSFSGVTVLHGVNFEVCKGEVHALVGENGAGKSTLVKIVAGIHQADEGRVFWKGREVQIATPRQAFELGISIVHQELTLVPSLSVAENIFLGRYPARRLVFRWLLWREMYRRAIKLLRSLGHNIDPRRSVEGLSVAEQQLIEIARALSFNSALIIMDEPTSPLSERETTRLFQTIANLKASGVSIIYISHRLKEIFEVADRVTVLRDGRHIITTSVTETDGETLVRCMVGREIRKQAEAPRAQAHREEALRVEGLTARGKFTGINFTVRRGEIVALAGLLGAGRTELVEALFGAGERDAGCVYLNGQPVKISTPAEAVRYGMALVTDDRKAKGLVLGASIHFNIALVAGRKLARHGIFLNSKRERELVGQLARELRIKMADIEQPVVSLSGGNQQKVVLAKWLSAGSTIFILDEPTRGIDVGSKAEIYQLIRQMAERGVAVLFVSSELDEVLHLADRILVMCRGRIAGELRREEASEEKIMLLATGGEAKR